MATAAPKNFARRDKLLEIEGKAQAKWEAAKAHEEDAPESGGALLRNSPATIARALSRTPHRPQCTTAASSSSPSRTRT